MNLNLLKIYKRRWINTRVEWGWNSTSERYEETHVEGYWYEGPVASAHNDGAFDQLGWAWYEDDADHDTSTLVGSANTKQPLFDEGGLRVYQLRILIDETAGGDFGNLEKTLEFRINGGGWSTVTAGTTVAFSASAFMTDGDTSTQRIGSGTYLTSNDGVASGTATAGGAGTDFAGNEEVEFVFCLEISGAAYGDEIEVRLASMDSYTGGFALAVVGIEREVPVETIDLSSTAPSVSVGEFTNPPVEDISVTGSAPVVRQSIEVPKVDISLSGTAPVVRQSIEVPKVDISLSGTAPVAIVNWDINVPSIDLTVSLTAPTTIVSSYLDHTVGTRKSAGSVGSFGISHLMSSAVQLFLAKENVASGDSITELGFRGRRSGGVGDTLMYVYEADDAGNPTNQFSGPHTIAGVNTVFADYSKVVDIPLDVGLNYCIVMDPQTNSISLSYSRFPEHDSSTKDPALVRAQNSIPAATWTTDSSYNYEFSIWATHSHDGLYIQISYVEQLGLLTSVPTAITTLNLSVEIPTISLNLSSTAPTVVIAASGSSVEVPTVDLTLDVTAPVARTSIEVPAINLTADSVAPSTEIREYREAGFKLLDGGTSVDITNASITLNQNLAFTAPANAIIHELSFYGKFITTSNEVEVHVYEADSSGFPTDLVAGPFYFFQGGSDTVFGIKNISGVYIPLVEGTRYTLTLSADNTDVSLAIIDTRYGLPNPLEVALDVTYPPNDPWNTEVPEAWNVSLWCLYSTIKYGETLNPPTPDTAISSETPTVDLLTPLKFGNTENNVDTYVQTYGGQTATICKGRSFIAPANAILEELHAYMRTSLSGTSNFFLYEADGSGTPTDRVAGPFLVNTSANYTDIFAAGLSINLVQGTRYTVVVDYVDSNMFFAKLNTTTELTSVESNPVPDPWVEDFEQAVDLMLWGVYTIPASQFPANTLQLDVGISLIAPTVFVSDNTDITIPTEDISVSVSSPSSIKKIKRLFGNTNVPITVGSYFSIIDIFAVSLTYARTIIAPTDSVITELHTHAARDVTGDIDLWVYETDSFGEPTNKVSGPHSVTALNTDSFLTLSVTDLYIPLTGGVQYALIQASADTEECLIAVTWYQASSPQEISASTKPPADPWVEAAAGTNDYSIWATYFVPYITDPIDFGVGVDLAYSFSAPNIVVTVDVLEPPTEELTYSLTAPNVFVSEAHDISVPQADLAVSTEAPIVVEQVIIISPVEDLTITSVLPVVEHVDNHTRAPPVEDLTLSTTSPAVSTAANIAIEIPVEDLTLSTSIPETSFQFFIDPPEDSVQISTDAPVLSVAFNLGIPNGSLAVTSQVPFVILSVEVPQTDLSFSSTTPAVSTSINYNLEVPVVDLVVSTFAPTADRTDNHTVDVPQEDLSLSLTAPVLSLDIGITIPSDNILFFTAVPVARVSVEVPVEDLSFSLTAPLLSIGFSLVVPTEDLTLDSVAPLVATSIEIPVTDLSLTLTAPLLAESEEIPVVDLVLSSTAPAVDQSISYDITVPVEDLSLSTTAPLLAESEEVPVVDLAIDSVLPIVALSENHFVDLPTEDLTLSFTAPLLAESEEVPVVDLVLSSLAPSVEQSVSYDIELPFADLSLTTEAPLLAESEEIPVADLTISVTTPEVVWSDNHFSIVPAGDLITLTSTPFVGISYFSVPPSDNLVVTVSTPFVGLSYFLTVPADDLALTFAAPVITEQFSITVPVEDLSLTSIVPSVDWTDTKFVTVPSEDLLFTGTAPSLGEGINVTTPFTNLSLTFTAPLISVSIESAADDLALTTTAPVLSVDYGIEIPSGDVSLAAVAPSVGTGIGIDSGDLIFSLTAPLVSVAFNLTIPADDLALTGVVPLVAGSIGVPAGDLAVSSAAPVIAITTHVYIDLVPGDLVLDTTVPSLGAGENITVPFSDLSISLSVPVLSESIEVSQGDLLITLAAPDVVLSDLVDIAVPTEELVLSGQTPVVGLSENVFVDVPSTDLALTTTAPVLSEEDSVEVPVEDLALSQTAPTVQIAYYITVPVTDLSLSVFAPDVGVAEKVDIPQEVLTLQGQSPQVRVSIEIGAGDLSVTSEVITVQQSIRITIPAETLVYSFTAPTVSEIVTIQIPFGNLVISPSIPQLNSSTAIVLPTFDLSTTGQTPDVRSSIEITAAALSLETSAPTVRTSLEIPAAALILTTAAPATATSVQPPSATLGLSSATVNVVEGIYLTVPQTDLIFSEAAPIIGVSITVPVYQFILSSDVLTPRISVEAGVFDLGISSTAPELAEAFTIEVPVVDLSISTLAPEVIHTTNQIRVSEAQLSVTTTIPTVDLSGRIFFRPPAADLLLESDAPRRSVLPVQASARSLNSKRPDRGFITKETHSSSTTLTSNRPDNDLDTGD